jgi:hypothetical protein
MLMLATLSPLAAQATGEIVGLITPADRQRLARYEAIRAAALTAARDHGSPADQAALAGALGKASGLAFGQFGIDGVWQCRTIRLGGVQALTVFPWNRCRVRDDGAGWRLIKATGAERTEGRFFDDGEARLIYLGGFYRPGSPPPPYGRSAASDQVGYAFRSGQRSWRIEFPQPARESKLDILEFRR